jgi:hypothetical protein
MLFSPQVLSLLEFPGTFGSQNFSLPLLFEYLRVYFIYPFATSPAKSTIFWKIDRPKVVGMVYPSRSHQLQTRSDTMTYQSDFILPTELLEEISANGFDQLTELIRIVVNAAIQAERQQYLGAAPYQRTPERRRSRDTAEKNLSVAGLIGKNTGTSLVYWPDLI